MRRRTVAHRTGHRIHRHPSTRWRYCPPSPCKARPAERPQSCQPAHNLQGRPAGSGGRREHPFCRLRSSRPTAHWLLPACCFDHLSPPMSLLSDHTHHRSDEVAIELSTESLQGAAGRTALSRKTAYVQGSRRGREGGEKISFAAFDRCGRQRIGCCLPAVLAIHRCQRSALPCISALVPMNNQYITHEHARVRAWCNSY